METHNMNAKKHNLIAKLKSKSFEGHAEIMRKEGRKRIKFLTTMPFQLKKKVKSHNNHSFQLKSSI